MNSDKMIKGLFESVDNMDADKFASFLHDNVSFIFGNAEPIRGKDAARKFVESLFSAIDSISHTIENVVEQDSNLMCRGVVQYTRKDGSSLTLPFANYFKIADGLIEHYQIYNDSSQLFTA